MANIKVHYANFPYTEISTSFGVLSIKTGAFQLSGESVTGDKFESIEISTEENVKKIGGAVGWGTVGGVLAGPVGILAGAMLGGNKKQVTFILGLTDDRQLMGTTDAKAYTELVAAKMKFDSLKTPYIDDGFEEYIPGEGEPTLDDFGNMSDEEFNAFIKKAKSG
ncbi:hypothetical protein ACQ86O_14680 [Serratia sp. L9]|uniref:hypothetical protein n=1 Tax=Serratia sp. L9 TaxID=3423946 RepID=UPI003D67ACE1